MSERQAKLNRKNQAAEQETIKHKKDPAKVISTIIAVIAIVAVAGLGGYAAYQKIAPQLAETATQDAQTEEQQPQTLASVAESEDTTVEELLEKCGMSDLGLTADSPAQDFYDALTIEHFAKHEGKTPDELKAEYGIKDLPNDTKWQDASMKVPMRVIAEQNGQSFADFASEQQLPPEITEDTTYEDAITIMQQAAQTAEAPETADAEATETAETTENTEDAE